MEKTKKYMLTTIDNPFNPFTQFIEWLQFDNMHDYGTCELLARFSNTSDQLSEEENREVNEQAIDDIIKYDPRGIYIKVFEE